MNSQFYITLKKIRETRHERDNESVYWYLWDNYIDIQKTIKQYSPETCHSLKKWVEHSYNQITKERVRIEGYFAVWQKKSRENLSAFDIGEINEEQNHFAEILNLIDDARADLLEHLVGLYPDEYNDEKCITLVKGLLSDSSEVKLQFLAQLENNQSNSSETKPVFDEKIIPNLISELKDYFPKQEKELENILKTGNDVKKCLVFLGAGIELGHTLRYLIKGRYITGVNQKQLGVWMQNNFKYYSRGKIHDYTPFRVSQIINDSKYSYDNTLFNISSEGIFVRTNKPK
jgi:hypothetical protein